MSSTPSSTSAKGNRDLGRFDLPERHAGAGWRSWSRRRKIILAVVALLLLVAIGLGIGLGVGLNRYRKAETGPSSIQSPSQPGGNGTSTGGRPKEIWKPQKGTAWHIVLNDAIKDTSVAVPVYDIDLFTNDVSTIASLHGLGRKVICYFSAGSYESYRPDSSEFTKADYGKPLQGWENEWWLNTRSENVRRLMRARLDLAASKGCDGVDPDNIDGYDNDSGLNLTQEDAIDYVSFLADEAHSRNLAVGLKNGASIVKRVLDKMEWEINEECVQYKECDQFRPFIDAGKPVFHIEYVSNADKAKIDSICDDTDSRDFSTLVKNLDLSEWYESCAQYR